MRTDDKGVHILPNTLHTRFFLHYHAYVDMIIVNRIY